ncbi:ATP-binding cassette domain-containing protein [Plantactinospora sp. BB1]|uniref:ABC transporter ATP-binding protein n=1 Tax=Plantactinospora sp. BB1 TaxID=2071627 RepID=UPI000D1665E8|nr:ATP-binding cassette domain-containing protein [Plantactinospora sp. BB1]AVT39508.1 ABC transporter ATP-binding protein [Plantactinospora sp. BB1]
MLRLRGAGRRFGRRTVFADLDLDLPAGVRLLVVGGNGSGKTTLLRCLAGTLTLSAGRATVAGHPVGSPAARHLVGVGLATDLGLYEQLTARDNLMLVARLRLPVPDRSAEVRRLEGELGVDTFSGTPIRHCSTGMRARVTIARALLGDPKLLLLDEPGRSLDDPARELLWAALDRRPRLGCVIASPHDTDRERCDRLLTLTGPR